LVVPTDAASLRAGLAPVHEALLSLHVLLHPWYHPLQHPWVRAMRSLSPALKRDVRTFAFLYYDATPDCFIPVGGDDEATFDAGLEAAAAFRAAGDPTRLEILRLVSRQPRTTEKLAALVGLSSSGLSKHLKALTETALVTSRRDGWYVLYSTERNRLAALSDDLLGYLDA
jgi:DNA-binding transcriptional ArsR family regulator